MLYTPGCDFMWSVDNFGATYSDAGIGVDSPSNASANVKGANTSMLVGIAEDCYGLAILFSGGGGAGLGRQQLVDLLVDPAAGVGNAGSSWAVAIANLFVTQPSLAIGGCWYYFPLYLKAGTAIGSANQENGAGPNGLRVGVRVFGKPTRPELLRIGTKVETFGAVTGSTTGTAMTPGTSAMGSYSASLGTTGRNLFWWQCGFGYADTTVVDGSGLLDVAASNDGGTTKVLCAENIPYRHSNTEQFGKEAFGLRPPYREIPTGATIYMRAAAAAAPETTPTVVAYGLGG